MLTERRLSLREAARRIGRSKDTIWRAVQKGELEADIVDAATGRRMFLDPVALDAWYRGRETSVATRLNETRDATPGETHATTRTAVCDACDGSGEAAATVETACETSREAAETVGETPFEQPSVPLEAHLQALRMLENAHQAQAAAQDEARRLERQVLALHFQLAQYQRALTENAESIAEREARARTAEARAAAAEKAVQQMDLARREADLHTSGGDPVASPPSVRPWWKRLFGV